MEKAIIEKEFNYKGFNGFVLATPNGWRCGYIEIPEGHKFYKKDYDDIDIDCHGGLTYSDDHIQELKGGWFIGFDCAHAYDGKDVSMMSEKMKSFYQEHPDFISGEDIVWTTEMVEKEINNIIEQLIK